jgi:hypothetical protein
MRRIRAWCAWTVVLICAGPAAGEEPAREGATEKAPGVTEEDRELARQVEEAVAQAQGTPAQEMANMVTSDWQAKLLKQLKGQSSATPRSLADARKYLKESLEVLRKGPGWPVLKGLRVPYAKEKPKIDGKLDDPAWKDAAVFEGVYPFNQKEKVGFPGTVWRVMWDEECLYFAFDCKDADIVAPQMKRDDMVYSHDCVEMFILPEFRWGLYWELVISPTGSIYDGLNAKKFKGWGPETRAEETIAGLRVASVADGTPNQSDDTDRGYVVEVAVPFGQLPGYSRGNRPAAGDKLRFMLVRLDQNGKEMKAYAFQPLLNWGHNIWNHAEAELAK